VDCEQIDAGYLGKASRLICQHIIDHTETLVADYGRSDKRQVGWLNWSASQ
jgi:hypothetical protein